MPARRASTLASLCLLLFVAADLSLTEASTSLTDSAEFQEWQDFREFKEFQAWKKSRRERQYAEDETDGYVKVYGPNNWLEKKRHKWGDRREKVNRAMIDPPPIDQAAMMARYIVNQAGWTSVATISSRKDIASYPFVNVISFSDGPLGNGTGVPYLFLTPLDFTAQDVYKDNRATLMMTLAQGRYCVTKDYDPMDPRCARVVLSGKIKAIKEDNPEFPTAKNAIYGRHPWLAHMPADHHFFFAKLKIGSIAVLDTFGGPKYVTVKDYMHPPNATAYTEFVARYEIDDESRHPLAIGF